jgi:hypothetical protein
MLSYPPESSCSIGGLQTNSLLYTIAQITPKKDGKTMGISDQANGSSDQVIAASFWSAVTCHRFGLARLDAPFLTGRQRSKRLRQVAEG